MVDTNKTFLWQQWLDEEFPHYKHKPEIIEQIKQNVEQYFKPTYVLTFYGLDQSKLNMLKEWIDNNIKNGYYRYSKEEYIFENINDVLLVKIRWFS